MKNDICANCGMMCKKIDDKSYCDNPLCIQFVMSNRDNDNHPKHYNNHPSGIECIAVTEHMNFNLGNAIKYIWRCGDKNGLEDLKKASWYINREIQRLEK